MDASMFIAFKQVRKLRKKQKKKKNRKKERGGSLKKERKRSIYYKRIIAFDLRLSKSIHLDLITYRLYFYLL